MRIAVLGDGLLGKSLLDAAMDQDLDEVDILDHKIFEIANPETLGVLDDYEVAINTVAFHRLQSCETDAGIANMVNLYGALWVARRIPTLYISTDYVFDGTAGPYEEVIPGGDPLSIYGHTKLQGELATLTHDGIVVRVSSLFGHHPSHKGTTFPEAVVHDLLKSYELPNDQRFSPTYVPDVAPQILWLAHLLGTGAKMEPIYHATNSGSTTWAAFGNAIRLACHLPPLPIVGYEARDPLRPVNSVLLNTKLPPVRSWKLGLAEWAIREGYI